MKKLALSILLLLLIQLPLLANNLITKGDDFYNKRATGYDLTTLQVNSSNINESIKLYEQARQSDDPAIKEAATVKLLRSYYFLGEYVLSNPEAKRQLFDKAKQIGENTVEEFPKSAKLNFWTGAMVGMWAQEFGTLAAAMDGAADKMKRYIEASIKTDPQYLKGAAYRSLGRLHFKSPNIMFVLAWPSKEKAIENYQKSLSIDPDNLYSKRFLAESYLEKGKKEEARKLLKEVVESDYESIGTVEDSKVRQECENLLKSAAVN